MLSGLLIYYRQMTLFYQNVSERYNHYEILRDLSQIIAATKSERREMMVKSDLSTCFENAREIGIDLQKWIGYDRNGY